MCKYCEEDKRKKRDYIIHTPIVSLRIIRNNGFNALAIKSYNLEKQVVDSYQIINYCPKCRKEAGIMIKQFCDICKVEMGREEILNPINTPKENFKICNQCLDEMLEYLENKGNNFKLENKRYERDYRNKWEEIC